MPVRDVGTLTLYVALIGGYLAWQHHLGWPGGTFGDRLEILAFLAAVPVAVVVFDIVFFAYAPWYTFSNGLVRRFSCAPPAR